MFSFMTPEEYKKEIESSMQRVTNRLIETKMASRYIDYSKHDIGEFCFTEDGIRFQDALIKLFSGGANGTTKLDPHHQGDIVALIHLVLPRTRGK